MKIFGLVLLLLSLSFVWSQNLEDIKKDLKGDRKQQTAAFDALLKINSLEAYKIHASHFGGENPYHRDKSYQHLKTVEGNGKWFATLPLTEKNPYARKLFLDLLAERAELGKKDDGIPEMLQKVLKGESKPEPLGAALLLAGKLKLSATTALVKKKLKFKYPRVRAYAYEALARIEGKAALSTLEESLKEKDYETKIYCVQMLAEFARNFGPRGYAVSEGGKEKKYKVDTSLLSCPLCNGEVRYVSPKRGEPFYGCRKYKTDGCKGRISEAEAQKVDPKKGKPQLDPELRELALKSAFQIFKDSDKDKKQGWRLKIAAMKVMGTYPDPRSIVLLTEYLKSEPSGKMPSFTALTLYQITDKDLGDSPKVWESWWKVNSSKWEPTTWGYKISDTATKGRSLASYYGLELVSDRIAFLLDGSGSMSDPVTVTRKASGSAVGPATQTMSFLERARQELFRTLKELAKGNPKAKIQVIFFQNKLLIFSPKKLKPVKPSIRPAEKFLKKVVAEQSGDMLAAIQVAMADPEVDTIIVLSDGAPSHGLHTIKELFLKWIREENRFRCIQFFGVIIGSSGRGKYIMQHLAEEHDGKAIEDDLVLRE